MPLEIDNYCFACGVENPVGLHLNIKKGEDLVTVDFTANQSYQGYNGIVHGGIIATILDELMVWAAVNKGLKVVTAEMNLRFKLPMQIGETIHGVGRVVAIRHKIVFTDAHLERTDGTLIAKATAKMLPYL